MNIKSINSLNKLPKEKIITLHINKKTKINPVDLNSKNIKGQAIGI